MCFSSCANLFFVLFILFCYVLDVAIAIDTITSSQPVKDPETLRSKDGNFTLGFFSPQNSKNRYVGIWWKSQSTVIWVANRNQPLNDSSGIITISEDRNLVVLNGQKQVVWSSNLSNTSSNTTSQFSDYGKLVLTETTTGTILWDSFQQPSDTLLPGMKLSSNSTSMRVKLASWKNPSNPSVGSFSSGVVERINILEVFVWNETQPYWRSGPWNGGIFTGIPTMSTYLNGFKGGDDGEGNTEIYYTVPSALTFTIYMLNSQGQYEEKWWYDEKKEMQLVWTSQESDCDVYGMCGPFTSCNAQSSPICSCLKGFEPRNKEEWNRQNWTGGCVRRTQLQCERVKDHNTSRDTKEDGFLKLQMVKVPDFPEGSPVEPDICRSQCLENCSCVAYTHDDGIGCMSWTGNLLDIQQFSEGGLDLYIRVAHTELDKGTNTKIIITITVIIGTVMIVTCAYVMWRTSNHPGRIWNLIKSARKGNNRAFVRFNNDETPNHPSHKVIEELSQVTLPELLLFNFERVATATNSFHLSNKLGQGGFGPVYKGKLQDGQEIAVKRLSRASGQGLEEFMNEVVVISKLQHRNLVRLFGCCAEGDEKMLIYEYMPNKSLDVFIFDQSRSKLLDWRKRSSIIEGIARGLLYLHRDSRLRIIHRDLKASNILLDEELNPKISDFGMARIFGGTEDQANTNRIAWIQWREGNTLSLMMDQEIYDPSHHEDILSELALPPPSQPAFILQQNMLNLASSEETLRCCSINITPSQSIKDPETLRSKDGKFTLGFFTPQNSTNRYVGIWWMSQSTIIWVADRNQPLNDSSGKVTISEDGNLVVLNGTKQVIWSSNMSNITSNIQAQSFQIFSSQICNCLKGFEPRIKGEWDRQNWSSGCVRSTGLQCETTGCMSWTGNLLDIQQFSSAGLVLYVRVAYAELEHDKGKKATIIITITVIIAAILIVTCACAMWRTYNHQARKRNNKASLLFNNDETSEHPSQKVIEELSQVTLPELLQLDFEMVAIATNNFHLPNKLGQGGFGPVYKGKLQDGQEIAVKRLSRASGQGLEEFMNEVVVISKLQHRNLVKLFGCCIEGDEKMLIYEYMPNKSLDVLIFDPSKSKLLDWRKRYSIIEGIARGLLYMHRDSRLRIIHRFEDKIFGGSEDQANTNMVVGTYTKFANSSIDEK
ncbi:G-type lectin S-receptor-like serine/threonine-protein kinase [Glycine soja]